MSDHTVVGFLTTPLIIGLLVAFLAVSVVRDTQSGLADTIFEGLLILIFDIVLYFGLADLGSAQCTNIVIIWTLVSGAIEFVRKNAQLRATTKWSWAESSGGDENAPNPDWLKDPVDCHTAQGQEEDGFKSPKLSDSYCYSVVGKNCYQDLATRKAAVFTIFASQFMLVGFIIFSTLDPDANFMLKGTSGRPQGVVSTPDNIDNIVCGDPGVECNKYSFEFFWCSFLMQLLASSQMGTKFSEGTEFWHFMLSCMGKKGSVGAALKKQTAEKTEIYVRLVMGFIANQLMYDFVIFLLPMILVQQGSHMDFVGNVFGIMFIATLDDKDGEALVLKDNVRDKFGLVPYYYELDDTEWDEDEAGYASYAPAADGEEALLGDAEEE